MFEFNHLLIIVYNMNTLFSTKMKTLNFNYFSIIKYVHISFTYIYNIFFVQYQLTFKQS
nr:MAG TPA: hypothetical protein [Caudoviricetes sp.]